MDLKKQILVALGLDKEEVMMAWQSKLEDGTIVVSTAETLEAGVDASVLNRGWNDNTFADWNVQD